ncbi:ATP-binding protein [Streptomyces johnsoniae]|uniref:AAA family ATPase n=1 Tax=Streptomyces johnsoniae TaxID=3075532 RepID=A0ABU2S585_9ACTN|nr:AAA family ATPase [Streptomyces sp. DSM 41886]MDT0444132.1 AAA family ATPase [Streptomyces sp. DSM 41886]
MERTQILERLDDLLVQSARGRGTVAAVSGSTAMGKTSVLDALADQAASAGSAVLSVVSAPHERDLPFGTLTQLLQALEAHLADIEPLGVDVTDAVRLIEPTHVAAAPAPPVAHDGLVAVARQTHRLVANLAAARPLLITVDDIQHTDAATLFCLRYLAQRLTQLPVTLVFTRGTSVEEQPPHILYDLLYQTSVRRFHLGPLSREGIRALAAGRSPCVPSDELVGEIHTLSVGNPLLVQALIEEHRLRAAPEATADSVVPAGDGPAVQPSSEGGLTTGHIFQQAVLACLHRLGPRAVLLAQCVALLDKAATPLLLSRLSGIDAELVRRYLGLLTGIGVLDGVHFRRSGVQQAVLREMPHDEATDLRHRVASLLHHGGAAPQTVAVHLLAAGPLHDDWMVPVLREAGRQALAEGDVAQGIRCLELARECCSEDAARLSVMSHYAFGQWQASPADSAQHFLALKGPALAGMLTTRDALQVAEGMMFHLHFDEALEVVDHLYDGNEDMTAALLGIPLLMASEFPGLLHRPRRPFPTTTVSSTSTSKLRARHALARALERGADEYAIALAEQVLQGTQSPAPWRMHALHTALLALCYADKFDEAQKWHEVLAAGSRRYDAPVWQGMLESTGALISLRRGQLADAVRQAEAAYALLSGLTWNVSSTLALAILVEAHTAMGNHQAVTKHLAHEPPPALFLTRAGLHYLYARGRHHLATGNMSMALSDFLECGTLMQRWDIDTPALAPWRLGAAAAWLRLGERDRAALLVEKQAATPDIGLTRSRGMALHGLAMVQPTAKQPPLLLEAFRLLEAKGAWYDAAAVLVDLSRAYQELGEKGRARRTARRAWRLAKSCGAEAMCQALLPTTMPRSAETKESTRSGGSERADRGTFEGLSESERRVAILAAQGYANREIADRLFITVSTVEQHLTRVYRKMGIRNRDQLLEGMHAVSLESV